MFEIMEKLCKENGISITALCVQLTGSKGNLATWKKGNIRSEQLSQIADYFGVTTDYLLGKETKADEWFRKNATPVGGMVAKPVLARVAAGTTAVLEEDIIDYQNVDPKYLTDEYFLLQVKGDSMEPRLMEGDIVIIKSQTSVDCGAVGVFAIDEQDGVIKKVIYGKNFIELHSFNPYYPVMRFENRDVLRVRVLGKIVDSIRKW